MFRLSTPVSDLTSRDRHKRALTIDLPPPHPMWRSSIIEALLRLDLNVDSKMCISPWSHSNTVSSFRFPDEHVKIQLISENGRSCMRNLIQT